jgi:hypothetical protein
MTPEQRTQYSDKKTYVVGAGATVRPCMPVKLLATVPADPEVPEIAEATVDSEDPIGFSNGYPTEGPYTEGQKVVVTHIFNTVEWTRVGATGATRGKRVVCAADGVVDAPAIGSGATRIFSPGVALDTGVHNDVIAVGIAPAVLTKT